MKCECYWLTGMSGLAALLSTLGAEACFADDVCPENPGGTEICVAWGEMDDPEEEIDFTVDYQCEGCDTAPEVELRTGSDTWRVWSIADGGGVGNIGKLEAFGADDYSVRIIKVVGATEFPGAANVGLLDLDPSNAANYSSLGGGIITGDLTGDLSLQRSSGDAGGTANGFVIGGDVYGDITAPYAGNVTIGSNVGCAAPKGRNISAQGRAKRRPGSLGLEARSPEGARHASWQTCFAPSGLVSQRVIVTQGVALG